MSYEYLGTTAGLYEQLMLQLVACASYACSRSTLRVGHEYLEMTARDGIKNANTDCIAGADLLLDFMCVFALLCFGRC